ncbi:MULTISPECIES: hypothetical protein [Enterobacteriaceae]|uniref:hypothetical protein n=1 Tax=Enterobacteriaceae TaxID=543 RepID=UPI0015DC3BFD|nr:hypothetical protein [Klebsiella sp. WP8-S18-ESBL-06]BBT70865.1 hypothetical protein WP8S18E06_21640 [Klebsiella sp. WP8-S18-ESBL-06]
MFIQFEPSNIKIITSSDAGVFITMTIALERDERIYFSTEDGLQLASAPWTLRIFRMGSENENVGTMYYLQTPPAAQLDTCLKSQEFDFLLSSLMTGNKPQNVSINTDGIEFSRDKKVWEVATQPTISALSVYTPMTFS